MGAPACIRLGQRCAHSSIVCAFEAGSCLKQGVLRGHVCSWCHTSVRSKVTLKSPKLVLGLSKFSFVSQLLHEALRRPQLQDTVLGTVQMCTLKVSKNCTHDAVKGEDGRIILDGLESGSTSCMAEYRTLNLQQLIETQHHDRNTC